MKAEQISVFIENKSGRLAEVTRILGDAEITSGHFRWPTPPISVS